MKQTNTAQRRLVIILAFLVLFGYMMTVLVAFGATIVPSMLTLVVSFAAFLLILIYLPKMKW